MYPSRPFLALLSLLACFCAACGGMDSPATPDAAASDALGGDSMPDGSNVPADGPMDGSADAPHDAIEDARADQAGPDVAGDGAVALDGSADAPADASAETGADVIAEASRDASADSPGDADPLLEQVTAVRVRVRAPGYDWTTARTQMCTITSGTVSIGAEYDAPERVGFAFLGPSTLTMIDGGRGTSDVRATMTRGATYSLGGAERANVVVRGMIPGGPPIELTALGCVVR